MSGMEEEGLPFGYTHGQQKVSAGGTKKPRAEQGEMGADRA